MDEHTERLSDLIKPIAHEVFDRLQVDLDDRDAAAISTAVTKAALAGFQAGVAAMAQPHQVEIDGRMVTVTISPEIHDANPGFDDWAERYGDG